MSKPTITIGEFLNGLAKKAKAGDHAALKDLLSNSELANKTMDKELADQIDTALMSEDAAISNSNVRNRIKAEVLNGADADFEKMLPGLELDDATVNELKGDKDTIKRYNKLVTKLQEARKAAAKAKPADKEDANKEVERLNGELRQLRESFTAEKDALVKTHAGQINDLMLQGLIAQKKLALPKEMDPQLKNQMAFLAVQSDLKARGVIIANVDGVLVPRKADGTKYFDEANREVSLNDLIDGSLTRAKLLEVTDPTKVDKNPTVITHGGEVKVNQHGMSAIEESLKDAGVNK